LVTNSPFNLNIYHHLELMPDVSLRLLLLPLFWISRA
jgi:hypothetical protein